MSAEGTAPAPDSPAGMGLLNYLSAHAMDDDYEVVAARRGEGAAKRSAGRAWPVALAVLAAFALLMVTAATQTSKNAVADAHEDQALIAQIESRKAGLQDDRTRVDELTRDIQSLRDRVLNGETVSSGFSHRLTRLGVLAGTSTVQGPGVTVVVDDAPGSRSNRSTVLDGDLQKLVNGLWQAGAEAIAINGHRLTALSAIRQAGDAITVNFRDLNRPYRIAAIGDPATLPARFAETPGGQTWLDLQRQVGLEFTMQTRTKLTLPPVPLPTLRFARVAKAPAGHGDDGARRQGRKEHS